MPADDREGTAKVSRLLLELQRNLDEANLSLKQQEETLGQVKVHGRDPSTSGPIFSQKGIHILAQYGLDKPSSPITREALRCLANAFLLNEPSRQTFVDLGYARKAADRLKVDDRDDEFLISRILFLLTYNTRINFDQLVNQDGVAESINQHMLRHAKPYSKADRRMSVTPSMEEAAMVETLKLMFNITYYHPDLTRKFTQSIEPLITIIQRHPLPSPPLQPPITYLLNALLNMDLKSCEKKSPLGREARSSPLFPYSNPEQVIDRLTGILDQAIREHPERDLDQAAAPLCTLMRRVYELAPPKLQSFMRWILLPNERDRDQPLGHGETLAARLLRLSCSPNLPTLHENISTLLFELSDKDPNKFVKNIGYGFASGFLMSHNIEIPSSALEANSTSTEGDAESGADFNPITGQRWSAEKRQREKGKEMTEEEKEREAERLFVLFERLKATGVVDLKNPVQQAVDEGRFEELD